MERYGIQCSSCSTSTQASSKSRGVRVSRYKSLPGTLTVVPAKYQVWSSVLKISLTSLYPNESKSETQILAGGAVIAAQVDGTVEWRSSEPVTGTSAVYNYSGFGSSSLVKESEPLGQDLETTDPGDDTPQNFQQLQNSAGEAEWQCMAKSGPWDCNFASLMDRLLRHGPAQTKPENPAKIPLGPGENPSTPGPPQASTSTVKQSCSESTDTDDMIHVCSENPGPINSGDITIPESVSSTGDNPNCILKILREKSGNVPQTKLGDPIKAARKNIRSPSSKEPPYGDDLTANSHDGIHINGTPGVYTVVANDAMKGKVLHFGPQVSASEYNPDVYGPMLSVLDIRLDLGLGNDPFVLTLKDMRYGSAGLVKGRVAFGAELGEVAAAGLDVSGEGSGLHVTLMTLSTYNKYINKRFSSQSRSSVPYGLLIDAARDPRSPFRCP